MTKFSLAQILKAWTAAYGEDMQTEYPGFISHLKKQDKPQAGKLYALTGAPGSKCIANGNTWEESVVGEEVKPNWSYRKNKDGFMGSENRVMKK